MSLFLTAERRVVMESVN